MVVELTNLEMPSFTLNSPKKLGDYRLNFSEMHTKELGVVILLIVRIIIA